MLHVGASITPTPLASPIADGTKRGVFSAIGVIAKRVHGSQTAQARPRCDYALVKRPVWVLQRPRPGTSDQRGPLVAAAPLIDRKLEIERGDRHAVAVPQDARGAAHRGWAEVADLRRIGAPVDAPDPFQARAGEGAPEPIADPPVHRHHRLDEVVQEGVAERAGARVVHDEVEVSGGDVEAAYGQRGAPHEPPGDGAALHQAQEGLQRALPGHRARPGPLQDVLSAQRAKFS